MAEWPGMSTPSQALIYPPCNRQCATQGHAVNRCLHLMMHRAERLCVHADNGLSGLCYGRVARDARPEPGTGIFRVSVEVSDGQFRDMLSTDIYSFRSASTARTAARKSASSTIAKSADIAEAEDARATDSTLPPPTVAPLVGQPSPV